MASGVFSSGAGQHGGVGARRRGRLRLRRRRVGVGADATQRRRRIREAGVVGHRRLKAGRRRRDRSAAVGRIGGRGGGGG